ncbi:hypothetical protein I3842_14G110500 [Carya illinoinensis]|uniref:Elongation factor 1-beta n=1 Tax=Carya illinoinensis TaxID=32201 RepID=A0A922D4M8_CARIL|nr:hypothetical protein I3842_14G110500 [Carya illinoinensis]
MAITFSDLHTESGLKSLDEFLSGKSYISGDGLTRDDIKVYAAVLEKPGNSFPNASKWYDAVSAQLAASFPGKAVGVRVSGKASPVEAAPTEEVKAAPAEDDDDIDLFGDETEEEKKAAEEREAAKKASSKKKETDSPSDWVMNKVYEIQHIVGISHGGREDQFKALLTAIEASHARETK